MTRLVAYVTKYGVALVFGSVLVEQIGIPIPALPTLLVAGSLARAGKVSALTLLAAAVAASLAADTIWYFLGKRYGHRVLKTLCRVSLSPDSCVRQTEGIFEKWGMASVVVAKFITGFSTVAPPLAGAMGAKLPAFLFYDALGTILWAGGALLNCWISSSCGRPGGPGTNASSRSASDSSHSQASRASSASFARMSTTRGLN